MPIYNHTTFPQDFWEYNFQKGGPWPSQVLPRIAYDCMSLDVYFKNYLITFHVIYQPFDDVYHLPVKWLHSFN